MSLDDLPPLLAKLARCHSASEVRGVAVDGTRMLLCSHFASCFHVDDEGDAHVAQTGTSDADVEQLLRVWRLRERLGVSSMQLATGRIWQIHGGSSLPECHRQVAQRLDVHHLLCTPLFGSRGSVSGALLAGSSQRERAFGASDLTVSATFSGFISAALVRVTAERTAVADEARDYALSPRELQVARLVARGHNNPEIALQLGLARETVKQTLRRVFRKTAANGRAQMAAKLACTGLL